MMKRIIWNNDAVEMYDDIKNNLSDFFPDDDPEDVSCEEIWSQAHEEIEANFYADTGNLNIDLAGEIVLVGDLVRWNGAFNAHTRLNTGNIGQAMEEALSRWDGDNTFEIYVEDGRMYISQSGHDNPTNPSVMEFRLVEDYDDWDGKIESSKPIGEYPAKVYGWEDVA